MASQLHTSIKIEGLDRLRRILKTLPENVQKNVMSDSVAKGALVIRDDARGKALILKTPDPRRTPGLLRRMIIATKGIRRGTEANAFVSVRRLAAKAISAFKRKTGKSSADNPNDPFYWRILEFGKSARTAHPFLRPAFNVKKEEAAHVIKEALAAGVEREANKLGGASL